jgi:small-conductance mechanosensitive channel
MPDGITLDRNVTRVPPGEALATFGDSEFGQDLHHLVRSTACACSEEIFEPRLRDALEQTRLTVGETGERLASGLQRLSTGLDDLLKSAKKADKEQQFLLSQQGAQLANLQRELLDLSRECTGGGKRVEAQLLQLAAQQRETDAKLLQLTGQQVKANGKLLDMIAGLQRDIAREIRDAVRISRSQFWILLSALLVSYASLLAAVLSRK